MKTITPNVKEFSILRPKVVKPVLLGKNLGQSPRFQPFSFQESGGLGEQKKPFFLGPGITQRVFYHRVF